MKDTKKVAEDKIYIIDGVICTKCVWAVSGAYGKYVAVGRYWNPVRGEIDEVVMVKFNRKTKRGDAEKQCRELGRKIKWNRWFTASIEKIKERAAEDGRRVRVIKVSEDNVIREGDIQMERKQKFSVAVYWTVQRSYEVEAESKEEAQRKIQEKVDKGEVSVWTDGFEAGDDVTVETQGVAKQNGEWEWFAPQEGK